MGEKSNGGASGPGTLSVDISDAISERDKVKFTVHTKAAMTGFEKDEYSVVREHEEFIWLHDSIQESGDYQGLIVPPPPPRPDFDASREKLARLGDGEASLSKDEFNKMKAELEAEYLATFKKTVAMHEAFLTRLANHPNFRADTNFRVFLTYESDLGVRGKNAKETVMGLFSKIGKSADEMLLSGQKDVDDWFETEKNYLVEYHTVVKEATIRSDKATRIHKALADAHIKVSSQLEALGKSEKDTGLDTALGRAAETLEKARKLEARVASDEDLKQSDVLRLWAAESAAGKHLLLRRARTLANLETANRGLERARAKGRDVPAAEFLQKDACDAFDAISELAKSELKDLKQRRVQSFAKALQELGELELKHAQAHLSLLNGARSALKA